jgi:hypothetical protein
MTTLKKFVVTSVLLAATAMPAHAGLVLDTFDYVKPPVPTPYNVDLDVNGTSQLTDSTAPDVFYSAAGAEVIYKLDTVSTVTALAASGQSNTYFGAGILDYQENNNIDSSLLITYNSPGATTIDFDSFGDSFYTDIQSADEGINVLFTVTSASGSSTASFTTSEVIVPGVIETLAFAAFSGFADFSAVTQVTAFFTSDASTTGAGKQFGTDFVLQEFGIVPEPSSVALLGLGLLGLSLRARKKLG